MWKRDFVIIAGIVNVLGLLERVRGVCVLCCIMCLWSFLGSLAVDGMDGCLSVPGVSHCFMGLWLFQGSLVVSGSSGCFRV